MKLLFIIIKKPSILWYKFAPGASTKSYWSAFLTSFLLLFRFKAFDEFLLAYSKFFYLFVTSPFFELLNRYAAYSTAAQSHQWLYLYLLASATSHFWWRFIDLPTSFLFLLWCAQPFPPSQPWYSTLSYTATAISHLIFWSNSRHALIDYFSLTPAIYEWTPQCLKSS
jgi:hypothetical protein